MQVDGVAQVAESPTELRRNAVGLAGVMMQALTDVAPAIAVLFTVQFTASQAGISMPAAYVGAFLIAIPIALVLCQLARRLPSAGGWYTYVSRGVHPRADSWSPGCTSCTRRYRRRSPERPSGSRSPARSSPSTG